jgi:hypothetical protein
MCQLKLEGCTITAPLVGGHAHHLNGKANGDDPKFIVASCESCNLKLGEPIKYVEPTFKAHTKWSTDEH